MTTTAPDSSTDERVRAHRRIKKRRDLRTHAMVYLLVNGAIVVIWTLTNTGGYFWPVVPIVMWGIGLVMNAWDVYVTSDISEADIDREIARMRRR